MIPILLLGCPKLPTPSETLAPIEVPADALSSADVRWYAVSGRDVFSLRESLRLHAPSDENGERTLGRTQWNATWTWKGGGEPCRVESAAVDLSLLVWMPRWTPDHGTDPVIIERWRGYLAALAVHERGHVELVTAQVAQLDDILRAAPCADADAVGALALEAIRSLNHDYDVATRHGRSQGAWYWTAPEWGASVEGEGSFAE
ncbi:hypothetical protein LBMAG42_31160 [Deltaproteobacteria bacterium]|nr:hypothetical protein LBMAG42_31160 [Deltaproteobacteria bacterium]